jgi:hypothetical protein
MEGFTSFGLGARGTHLGEVVTPDSTRAGMTSITAHACLHERVREGHQTLVSRDHSALSAIKFHLSDKELVL